MPLGDAKWHKIMPYLHVYDFPYHSVTPSAQSLCHSVTPSGSAAERYDIGHRQHEYASYASPHLTRHEAFCYSPVSLAFAL